MPIVPVHILALSPDPVEILELAHNKICTDVEVR